MSGARIAAAPQACRCVQLSWRRGRVVGSTGGLCPSRPLLRQQTRLTQTGWRALLRTLQPLRAHGRCAGTATQQVRTISRGGKVVGKATGEAPVRGSWQ